MGESYGVQVQHEDKRRQAKKASEEGKRKRQAKKASEKGKRKR
jgi:hypothetical protein